jgi:hypothetical protein
MSDEIVFQIANEQGRRDLPPFRAYFTWLRDGQIVRSADFSVSELQAEIARCRGNGETTDVYDKALRALELY